MINPQVVEHAPHHHLDQVIDRRRPAVETGTGDHHCRAGLIRSEHVPEVDPGEGHLPHQEHERTPLF